MGHSVEPVSNKSQELVKSQDSLRKERTEIIRNLNKGKGDRQALLGKLEQTTRLFVEQKRLYIDLFYSDYDLLARTENCYSKRFENKVDARISDAFFKYRNLYRNLYPQNKKLVKALTYLPDLQPQHFYEGFCVAIVNRFLRELADKKTYTEADIIAAAQQFSAGLSNPQDVAMHVMRSMISDTGGRDRYLTFDKVQPHPFDTIVDYHNLFAAALGEELKFYRIEQNDLIRIPEDLPVGLYSVSICGIKPGMVLQQESLHRLAYVKVNDGQSYVLDPNIGLIRCSRDNLGSKIGHLSSYYIGKISKNIHTTVAQFTLKEPLKGGGQIPEVQNKKT